MRVHPDNWSTNRNYKPPIRTTLFTSSHKRLVERICNALKSQYENVYFTIDTMGQNYSVVSVGKVDKSKLKEFVNGFMYAIESLLDN